MYEPRWTMTRVLLALSQGESVLSAVNYKTNVTKNESFVAQLLALDAFIMQFASDLITVDTPTRVYSITDSAFVEIQQRMRESESRLLTLVLAEWDRVYKFVLYSLFAQPNKKIDSGSQWLPYATAYLAYILQQHADAVDWQFVFRGARWSKSFDNTLLHAALEQFKTSSIELDRLLSFTDDDRFHDESITSTAQRMVLAFSFGESLNRSRKRVLARHMLWLIDNNSEFKEAFLLDGLSIKKMQALAK